MNSATRVRTRVRECAGCKRTLLGKISRTASWSISSAEACWWNAIEHCLMTLEPWAWASNLILTIIFMKFLYSHCPRRKYACSQAYIFTESFAQQILTDLYTMNVKSDHIIEILSMRLLWDKEELQLQLDSHMRFVPGPLQHQSTC